MDKSLRILWCVFFIALWFDNGFTLFIDGCPMFGCRPSGSFSFYLQVPRSGVSVQWISDFDLDPIPDGLGCVADSVAIVCPSNGPFPEDTGYVSLFIDNGTIRWRDRKLHFPSLPLLDNYGDVTGSDGVKCVHYDQDGKQYPVINCEGLVPMFNMALVGNSFLLLVSSNGFIVVRQTNGIPVGSLFLNATFNNVNGTFVPIAQPVVNHQRFYLLTQFVPQEAGSSESSVPGSQRLYAIDVHQNIVNRITIAWYKDVPILSSDSIKVADTSDIQKLKYIKRNYFANVKDTAASANASLIWNRYNQTVFVVAPYKDTNVLLGVHDKGDTADYAFQAPLTVSHMAMFVSDHCYSSGKANDFDPILWANTNSQIYHITSKGELIRGIDLEKVFNAPVTVTTKLSVVRNSDDDTDILIFGISMSNNQAENDQKSFVVAIDTANQEDEDVLLWKVPIPDDMIALGQIVGVGGADTQQKDQLIVYAELPGKSAKILSIG